MGTPSDLRAASEFITRAWFDVLELQGPDKGKGFLAQGGDSLRGTQLCLRLQQGLGIRASLATVLGAASLTQLIRELLPAPASPAAQALGAVSFAGSADAAAPAVLSFSQERMWFMHELAAASAAYHVPMAWRLRGHLDTAALRTALGAVLERHPVLRMTVVSDGANVVPRYSGGAATTLREIDIAPLADGPDLDSLSGFLSEFTNAPFSLDHGPLCRIAVASIGPDDAVLLVVMHHIVGDQWALDVFFRELAAAYRASLAGSVRASSPPQPSYARYAAAHRAWFLRERRGPELDFWRSRLEGLETVVLNEDYARPPQQSFRGAKLRLDFNLRDIAALRALGATHGATLAMVLLTALKILLFRHTGRTDVAVGVPVANRHHDGAEPLLGTLVNTLVMRTELAGQPDFITALQRVRATMLEALQHQDLPFEMLVQSLQLPRDASRSPLFSVMFNMLNTPLGEVQLPGLTWSRFEFDKKASQFDLTITIDADHARSISFEYSTDLFSADTIQRLSEHYLGLLRAVIQRPTLRIDAAALIPENELRLLREWAQGPRTARAEGTIPALLQPAWSRHAASLAIRFENEALTYAQLSLAVTKVAQALRSRGIGRGARVGLYVPRSPRMLIGLLGILQAGAAYVPLDPAFPPDRLAFMARDAGLLLLLSDGGVDPKALGVTQQLAIGDILANGTTSEWQTDVALEARPNDPAYVIYTSGSTGQPKGVVVPHRAVVNFLRSMLVEPGLAATERLLAITTLSFDIAVLELLLPLTVGAELIVASPAELADGETLRDMLNRRRVTTLQATPSTWRLLIDSGWHGTPGLRALVGGEALTTEVAIQLSGRCAEVWNMYGPTETTVWSACGRIENLGRERVSLGRPIANTEIMVLDENRALCPIGVPGEICIGGDGVAIGYLNQPALTDERFIENPFSRDRRTTRLYRTGDRGRWRRDGRLEHLGRLDSQVKVRGYRIELGEIEARLATHPDIAAAVVVAREQNAGDPRLVAYVVPRQSMPDTAAVRDYLRQWLPEYMLPQHYISLERIPLLPNGKTDRQKLPAPTDSARRSIAPTPPRNLAEQAVWEIWRQTLDTDAFGVHDNFFDLGGHSLLAVRMVSRIRSELQRACTLPIVFRNPTIAELSIALGDATALSGSAIIPLQAAGNGPPIFCLCGILIYQELADQLAPDFPAYGVFVPQELEYLNFSGQHRRAAPSVAELATEYLKAIRDRQPQGPYRLIGFSFGGVLAFDIAQTLTREGEQVELLAILDSDVPGRGSAGILQELKAQARQIRDAGIRLIAGTESGLDLLASDRDQRYLETMRAYQAEPYPGQAFCVLSADGPVHDPGYTWEALIPRLTTHRIEDSHLGILRGTSVVRLASLLRQHLRRTSLTDIT